MINAKVKIFSEEYSDSLEIRINVFLKTIDTRQIIKTEYSSSASVGQYNTIKSFSAIIYYVEFEDIREVKIDSVLEIK
jgi:hypothetical protein